MSMGFSLEKVLLIMLLAALIVGPDRLPKMASGLATLVRRARLFADDTKSRLKDEMGEEFDDIDWRDLDPRQYDPRRIIREALAEPLPARETVSGATPQVTLDAVGPSVAESPAAQSAAAKPDVGHTVDDGFGSVSNAPATTVRVPFDDQAT